MTLKTYKNIKKYYYIVIVISLISFFSPVIRANEVNQKTLENCQDPLGGDFFYIEKIPTKPNPVRFAQELDQFLGLSFMATSVDIKKQHFVYVETEETLKLSEKFGEKIVFQASFTVGPIMSLVTIPFEEMTLVRLSNGEKIDERHTLKPESDEFLLEKLYFTKFASLNIPNSKVEMLPMQSIEDIQEKYIDGMSLACFLFLRGSVFSGIKANSKFVSRLSSIFEIGFQNMQNPAIQNQVVEIILEGKESIELHLNKIGFTLGKTVYKHVPQKVWAHTMGLKESYQPGVDQLYPLMVEGGDFAVSHGAYAHQAQMLAFFWNMPKDDVNFFVESLMRKQRSDDEVDWYSWVTLFDGDYTKTPITAFFWHNKIEEAKNLNNP